MTAVPVTRTFVAGEVVLASYFNTNINGPINFLLSPPLLEMRQTSAQTFTTGVSAAITCTTEDVDSSGMHSTSTNTSRATAVYPGWYQCGGGNSFVNNATGSRGNFWVVNATSVNGSVTVLPTVAGGISWRGPARSKLIFLNVGDYLEMWGFQNSGGNLAADVTTAEQPNVSVIWNSN